MALLGAAAFTLTGPAQAQKEGEDKDKALEKNIEETLRRVIDHGADIYNKQSDYNGCFRLYEGALIAIKPVLTKYPDLQKAIDDGLAGAYTRVRVDERAHALRVVLGSIRMTLNPNLRPPGDAEKKGETKDTKDTKNAEKLPDPSLAQVRGKVLLMGKLVPSGYVVLVGADGGRSSSKIQKDGTYDFSPGIPPGEYTVTIQEAAADENRVAIPQKYQAAATSALRLTATKGAQTFDVNLE
jgi:hypothetical protein